MPPGSRLVFQHAGCDAITKEITGEGGLRNVQIEVALANGRIIRDHLKDDGTYLICVGDERPALLEFSCIGFEKKSIANPAVGKREIVELQALGQ